MSTSALSRRRVLQAAGVAALAAASPAAFTSLGPAPVARAAVLPPARDDIGVSAFPFDLEQVRLTASRWMDNQNRTLTYLRFIDVDRLHYTFRANHGLSTNGTTDRADATFHVVY